MKAAGRARVDSEIVDLSILVDTGLKGINAVLGVTERGTVGKSVLVGSWLEYNQHFGGLIAESKFPLICKRALERGGKLRIARAAHYTDPTDASTVAGVKSSVEYGAALSGDIFEAANIGAWGNGLKVTVTAPANGAENEVSVLIQLAGSPELDQIIENIPATITEAVVDRFNEQARLVKMVVTTANPELVVAEYQLASGAEDKSLIVEADYLGDKVAGTGIFTFDGDNDFVKIAIPELAIPEVDIALLAYVESRKDCRAVLRTPTGISGLTAIGYREGTDLYTHTPLDTMWGDMFFAGLEVRDDRTGGRTIVPSIGDVLGAMSTRDNKDYEWFTVAGQKRGRIKNAYGVDYNLGSAGRASEFDQVDIHGINPVIDDKDFGLVIWGNSSLSKANNLQKHSNVCDLLVFLMRSLPPLIKTELFDPNDIETWKAIFRNVKPLMELVKNKRGIWNYLYQGDQFIDDVSEAVVNSSQNIDAGQYIFHLWIQPKVGMKYAGVKVVVTNSGVNFEELSGQPVV